MFEAWCCMGGIFNFDLSHSHAYYYCCPILTTLALGSQSRPGLERLRAKRKFGNHISCSQECKRMWMNKPSHYQRSSHFAKLKSQWTLESSKGNFRGQNSLDWTNPYTIKNLLEYRCLKWVPMTHLDIWNTSYGQKKGQESNRQFREFQDSHLEVLGQNAIWMLVPWPTT
jgi:hypothetical protein